MRSHCVGTDNKVVRRPFTDEYWVEEPMVGYVYFEDYDPERVEFPSAYSVEALCGPIMKLEWWFEAVERFLTENSS